MFYCFMCSTRQYDDDTWKQHCNVLEIISDKATKMVPENKTLNHFCSSWKAVLAEFISTTLLVLLGCMACIPIGGFPLQPPLYGSLGFGLIVLFNIQAFGHISGAHMNPAVTLGAMFWGRTSIGVGFAYIIAQCLGGITGYGILMLVSPVNLVSNETCVTQPHAQHTMFQALAIEVILTAALNFLNCAFWDPSNGNSLESGSIKFGLTIVGFGIAGSHLTGASMNPARSLGPALITGTWDSHWVYWVGPFLGGSLSTIFYKYVWLDNSTKEAVIG